MVEMLDELLIPYTSIPKNVHPINVLNEIHKKEAHLSKIFQKNHPMHSSQDVTYSNSCFNRCPPNANYNPNILLTNKVKL
jgi:hypothetical protein